MKHTVPALFFHGDLKTPVLSKSDIHTLMTVSTVSQFLTLCILMGSSFWCGRINLGKSIVHNYNQKKYCILLSEDLFYLYKQCRPWVFTVCKSTHLGVSRIQSVKGINKLRVVPTHFLWAVISDGGISWSYTLDFRDNINTILQRKIVNIFLPIIFDIQFGCSKELSHEDGSFEYPQHMFWLRNEKINFLL